ncbi:MAG: hypothetical protein ABH854_02615 [Candidatus Diapherotrites archaeon]
MAVGNKIKKTVNKPAGVLFKNLLGNLERDSWEIIHKGELELAGKKKAMEIFGVSSMFGGSTLLSAYVHGARYVPFFIRVHEVSSGKSEILAIAGGAEKFYAEEFGRNEKVVEKIVKYCLEAPKPKLKPLF